MPTPLQSKADTQNIIKIEPKKATNLFEDSDEEDDFINIKPKNALTKKVEKPVREELPQKDDKEDEKKQGFYGESFSKTPIKPNETPAIKNVGKLFEKENPIEGSKKQEDKPIVLPKESKVTSDVDTPKSVKTPKKLEITLFDSSDDESDFVIPAKAKVEPKPEESDKRKKPDYLNIVKAIVPDLSPTQTVLESKEDDKSGDFLTPTDSSFKNVSITTEDTSSELFSPQSDVYFTPSDVTPNTTTTTATPVTPIYRSFIDELPPDDDFTETYDTNEFDTGYNPEDTDNFDQDSIPTATDPFLFNEEPPELINEEMPVPDVETVSDNKIEIPKPKQTSPETFKNKFKMFETVNDSSRSPPEIEKNVKPTRKKLNVNLNINVSALLPGAKRPSPKKIDDESTTVPNENQITPVKSDIIEGVPEPINSTPEQSPQETTENQPNLLVSLNKNRIRGPLTRKPSTRKARVQNYHESTIKQNDNEYEGTEQGRTIKNNIKISSIFIRYRLTIKRLSKYH